MSTIRINEATLAQSYAKGDYKLLIKEVIDYLTGFNELKSATISAAIQANIDLSVEAITYYLSRIEFNVDRETFTQLLTFHSHLTYLIALSSYDNSEALVETGFRKSSLSLPSMLFHLNRNSVAPPRTKFFDLDARMATVWYGQYFVATRSFVNPRVNKNLKEHLAFWDERMPLLPALSNGYMRSTYIDPENDRKWRINFNNLVKKSFSKLNLNNHPNKKKIALITGRWAKINPTYKNRYPLVKALAEKYELVLIHCGEDRTDLETSLFSEVKQVAFKKGTLDMKCLQGNDFGMVYYPDIGMNIESRFLSNLRIAPVQVMSNSHPVSTFGSEIDYFLTGKDSESAQSPQRFYTERLVLVPGIGTQPELTAFQVSDTEAFAVESSHIACPWGSLKINTALVERLKLIDKKLKGAAFFNFFVSMDVKAGAVPILAKEIAEILGKNKFSLYANLEYSEYIKKLRTCNFAVDAFPFGGNTSVIDCLFSKVPIVAQKGWQFYNMAGPVMLEKFGLSELVVRNENEYVETALRLFSSPKTVARLREKMSALNLEEGLRSLTSTEKFIEAFDHMMEHPRSMKITKPLEFI